MTGISVYAVCWCSFISSENGPHKPCISTPAASATPSEKGVVGVNVVTKNVSAAVSPKVPPGTDPRAVPPVNRVSDAAGGSVNLSVIVFRQITAISHLYSLRDFWRHYGLCRAAAHSDCCFFAPCTYILTRYD